jgi:DNA gyrase subunit B
VPALSVDAFAQPDQVRDWARDLERTLNAPDDATRSYRIDVQVGGESHDGEAARPARIVVRRNEHGSIHEKALPREFFASAEYSRITELGLTLAGMIGEGASVTSGNQRREIGSFKEAVNWLFDQARKGQTMQRYKGLGEMNPDQLWETTINPETRRLLQVRIEDAIAADEIFNTLMGDQVEPRREFIEKNALTVANLDV